MLWEEYGGYLFTGYTTSSLRWHDFYLGFCMELGNLNMDVNLFVNLPMLAHVCHVCVTSKTKLTNEQKAEGTKKTK